MQKRDFKRFLTLLFDKTRFLMILNDLGSKGSKTLGKAVFPFGTVSAQVEKAQYGGDFGPF